MVDIRPTVRKAPSLTLGTVRDTKLLHHSTSLLKTYKYTEFGALHFNLRVLLWSTRRKSIAVKMS